MDVCSVIVGRGEFGCMNAKELGTLKVIWSGPELALACWMAALKVQEALLRVRHTPSTVFASGWSPAELTTKGVEAWAGLAATAIISRLANTASVPNILK